MRPIRTRLAAGAVCTGAALLLGPLAATPAYAAPASAADDTPEDTQTPQAADGSGAIATVPALPARPDDPVSTDPQQTQSPLAGAQVVTQPVGDLAAPLTSTLEGTVDTTADKTPQQTSTPQSVPAQDQPQAETPTAPAGEEGEQAPESAGSDAEAERDKGASKQDKAKEKAEKAAEEAKQAEAEKADEEAQGTPTSELGAEPAGPTPAGGLPEAESSCSEGTLGCSDEDARSDSAAPRRAADSSVQSSEPEALPRTGAATGLLPIGAALLVLGAFAAGSGRHRRPFGR